MPKAKIKKVISIVLPLTYLFFIGCSSPEEKKAKRLQQVAALQASGDTATALATLDTLSAEYPNDTTILRQIGSIHQELGNTAEAAFYLSAAHSLSPNDVELLYQTYRAQENAQQPTAAAASLEALAQAASDAITPELWRRLGEFRAEAQQTQPALDAYLKGVNPENRAPTADTALAIGTLFKQLDNLPQAERWLRIAADSDDPNALPALFGLLEIQLRNKNWTAAESAIVQLDKQFPGAIEASEWAAARGELEAWRKAQTEMKAELAKAKAKAEAAQEAEAAARPKAAEATTSADQAQTEAQAASASASQTSGKAQIVEDIQNAEAIAHTPALEAEATETASASISSDKAVSFDPSIAIQPAEPALTFEVNYDQQTPDKPVHYSVAHSNRSESASPLGAVAIAPATSQSTVSAETLSEAPSQSLTELLASAEQATAERAFKQAIGLYWKALGRANQQAGIWNKLSGVYLMDGQNKNAETTALEAMRLAPDQTAYILDYLRVIQNTKQADDFLAELQSAYKRFPRSAEIALALARGNERIAGNNSAARTLYQRFIELAPDHPLRPEAESALTRLR